MPHRHDNHAGICYIDSDLIFLHRGHAILSKIFSASLIGIDAHIVEVEVDITAKGLPHFSTVGLPYAAVKESKDRVRATLRIPESTC